MKDILKIFSLVAVFFITVCCYPIQTQAEETETQSDINGVYLTGKVILNAENANLYTGYGSSGTHSADFKAGASFAAGYDFYYQFQVPVRLELEYAIPGTFHANKDGMSIRKRSSTLAVNALYDFRWLDWVVTPYAGLGMGITFNSVRFDDFARSNHSSFAVQGIIGLSYPFTKNWFLDVNYKLLYNTNVDAGYGCKVTHDFNNQFGMGVRYCF